MEKGVPMHNEGGHWATTAVPFVGIISTLLSSVGNAAWAVAAPGDYDQDVNRHDGWERRREGYGTNRIGQYGKTGPGLRWDTPNRSYGGSKSPNSMSRREQVMKIGWIGIALLVAGILVLIFPNLINTLIGITFIVVGILSMVKKWS